MKIKFLSLIILSAITYSQCDLNTELECDNNNQCEWIADIQIINCNSLGSTSCENYSDYGCEWTFSWGGWQNYGSSCSGGSVQVDQGYCEEIQILEFHT